MQQSLCFFVLLNLDFSCDLSERTNENIFGSNQAIRKIMTWIDPEMTLNRDLKLT